MLLIDGWSGYRCTVIVAHIRKRKPEGCEFTKLLEKKRKAEGGGVGVGGVERENPILYYNSLSFEDTLSILSFSADVSLMSSWWRWRTNKMNLKKLSATMTISQPEGKMDGWMVGWVLRVGACFWGFFFLNILPCRISFLPFISLKP